MRPRGNKVLLKVKVWCLPHLSEGELQTIWLSIVRAVEKTTKLGISGKESILVLFPSNHMQEGLGEEISIEVTDAPASSLRPVLDDLATNLVRALEEHIPGVYIDCSVKRRDRKSGFYRSR